MFYISRVHVAHAGYRDAWWEGSTLDFQDADNMPASTVIRLPNEGGKTTLLSLILSVFEPRKDQFLQTRKMPNANFMEYFGEDSCGLVAIEWRPAEAGHNDDRRLISAQVVHIGRNKSGALEDTRIFVLFQAEPGLTLEDMPFHGLAGRKLHTLGDVRRWLDIAQREHPSLRFTENQSHWKSMLSDEGIDADLLGKQGDFSMTEGGMDRFISDIRSEGDFVRTFLGMTLDADRSEQTRVNLRSALDKLKHRPRAETQSRLLEALSQRLNTFAGTAASMADAETERAAIGMTAADLRRDATHSAAAWEVRIPLAEAEAEAHALRATASANASVKAEGFAECLLHAAHGMEVASAAAATSDATARALDAARQVSLVAAAEARGEIVTVSARRVVLERQMGDAGTSLEPLRAAHRTAVGALASGYLAKRDEIVRRLDEISCELSATNRSAQDAETARSAAQSSQGVARTRLGRSEAMSQARENSLAALRRAGHLLADETVEVGEGRLTAEVSTSAAAVTVAETVRERLNEVSGRSRERRVALIGTVKDEENRHADIGRRLAKAISMRGRLVADDALNEMCEGDVDPDAPGLPDRMSVAIAQLDVQITYADRLCEDLHRATRDIVGDSVAVDEDVRSVADFLIASGIRDAKPRSEHVASLIADAALAREAVRSDPAIPRSIVVYTDAQMSKARAALAGFEVRRPVILSRADGTGTQPNGSFVLMPPGDEGWNRAAAATHLGQLRDRLSEAQLRKEGFVSLRGRLRTVQADVQRYAADHAGTIEGLGEDSATSAVRLQGLKADLEAAHNNYRAAEKDIADAMIALRSLVAKSAATAVSLSATRSHALNHEAGHVAILTETASALEALSDATAAVAAAEARLVEIRTRRDELRESNQRTSASLVSLDRDVAALPPHDADVAATGGIDAMRAEMEQIGETVRAFEARELGPLAGRLQALRDQQAAMETRYARDHVKVDVASVEAFLAVENDFEVLRAAAETERTLAERAQGEAAAASRSAIQAEQAFSRGRRHPDFVLGDDVVLLNPETARMDAAEAIAFAASLSADADASKVLGAKALGEVAEIRKSAARLLRAADTLPEVSVPADGNRREIELLSPDDMDAFETSVSLARKSFATASAAFLSAETVARRAFEAVRDATTPPEFVEHEPMLAQRFRTMIFEAAAGQRDRLSDAIVQRMQAVSAELADMDPALENCVANMSEFHTKATLLLRRASEDIRLPDCVPNIGNKTVVRIPRAAWKSSDDDRKVKVGLYVRSLLSSNRCPATAAEMGAEIIRHVAGGDLGIELLKVTDIGETPYWRVGGMNASGAQGMTSAMLLFIVSGAIRLEERLGRRRVRGQVLLLDNPFAVANKEGIVRLQVEMARMLGVQLIFLTGVDDANALGVFDHFVCVNRLGKQASTRRMVLSAMRQTVHELEAA